MALEKQLGYGWEGMRCKHSHSLRIRYIAHNCQDMTFSPMWCMTRLSWKHFFFFFLFLFSGHILDHLVNPPFFFSIILISTKMGCTKDDINILHACNIISLIWSLTLLVCKSVVKGTTIGNYHWHMQCIFQYSAH